MESGKKGKMDLSHFEIAQNFRVADAATDDLQRKRRKDGEDSVAEGNGANQEDQLNSQEPGRGQSRNGMQKPSQTLRCTLLNGSAWSTERKYVRRYQGAFDMFFELSTESEERRSRSSSTHSPSKDGDLHVHGGAQEKVYPDAGPKARMASWLRKRTITLSLVKVCRER